MRDVPVASPQQENLWGSDAIAAMLRALDIPYLALNPGASYRGLHDSIVNYLGNSRPQMLLCLHEEAAVAIAHGYAKACGRMMGVVLHSNVGLMHGSMAIFNAWCDRVPMLILGATGPWDAAKRRPWIDWIHTSADQGALVRDYTKWDNQPASVPAAYEALLRAVQIADTAPRGPTYVNLDAALQEAKIGALPALPEVGRFSAPVVFTDIEIAVVREFDAVPTVTLILHPHRSAFDACRVDCLRRHKLLGFITAAMSFGGNKFSVHGFMRQVKHERLLTTAFPEPLERIVRQFISDVTFLRNSLSVNVQSVFVWQIRSLSFEADPVIETGLRMIDVTAHVPLTDERSFVTRALKVLRKINETVGNGAIGINHVMPVSIHSGAYRRSRRRA
jgi:hypothetical protein